jgi:hypothetical protein
MFTGSYTLKESRFTSLGQMENLLATAIDGRPTNYRETFRGLVSVLDTAKLEYCLGGVLALNMYMRPRFTDEILVICSFGVAEECDVLLKQQSVLKPDMRVKLRSNSVDCWANRYALDNKTTKSVFDTTAQFASPIAILCTLLESEDLQDEVDAGQLLHAELIENDQIDRLLKQHQAKHAAERLVRVRASITAGGFSGTYNESVKARLQRMKQKTQRHPE